MLFTSGEREIIQHRLDVPDALADVFTDCDDPWDETLIEHAITELEARLRFDAHDEEAWLNMTELECLILKDCLEGSTWCGAANGNVSDRQLSRIRRQVCQLADKVSRLIKRRVHAALA